MSCSIFERTLHFLEKGSMPVRVSVVVQATLCQSVDHRLFFLLCFVRKQGVLLCAFVCVCVCFVRKKQKKNKRKKHKKKTKKGTRSRKQPRRWITFTVCRFQACLFLCCLKTVKPFLFRKRWQLCVCSFLRLFSSSLSSFSFLSSLLFLSFLNTNALSFSDL